MAIDKLSNRLYQRINSEYGPEDNNWVQFVKDHKRWLIKMSSIKKLTTYDLQRYKYRPTEFMINEIGFDKGSEWILLFINDIRSPEEFNETITQLRVVDSDVITQLRKLFEQTAFARS